MYRRVLAFDFDGTLVDNGVVPSALQTALKFRDLFPEGCKIPNRQTIAPNKSLRGPEEQFRPALHSSERVGNRASVRGQCLARGPEVDRQYERGG